MNHVFKFFFLLAFSCNVFAADLGTTIVNSIFSGKSMAQTHLEQKQKEFQEARAVDPALFDNFYSLNEQGADQIAPDLGEDGYIPAFFQNYAILFKKGGVTGQNSREIDEKLQDHVSSVGKDLISKKYIKFAKSRGNTVVLYKPEMALYLRKATNRKYAWTTDDWTVTERCLVEFNKDGEIVSALGRFHYYDTSVVVGFAKDEYTEIVFGKAVLARFQDSLSETQLAELKLKTF